MKKFIAVLVLAGSSFLAGCGDSQESYVFTNTGVVASAPVARNDAYTVEEDTSLTVQLAQSVLVNDTLNAGGGSNITVTFPAMTTQGGTLTGTANMGVFTYTPAVGFVGTDTFTYILANGSGASSSATVTIAVTAAQVQAGFFVDAANGNDATGDFTTGAPFATIQAAVADAPENSDIVVRPGNYTGAITLKDGQRLLGSGSGLVNAQGAVRPELTGPVVLADGNTLDFLRIEGTNGDAVDGSGQNGGTVTNCEIDGATGGFASGVVAEPGFGTWTVTGNTITNTAGLGVLLQTSGTSEMTARVNDNAITGNGLNAIGFVAEGDSELVAQAHDNTMTGNQDNFTFEAIAGDNASMCLDIEDNINDDVYSFAALDAAVLSVEQLSQLESINQSGTVDIASGGAFVPPVDVADGFCGFVD